MSTHPTISIVTCSYQQARFLDATMRSVLAQQYPALEYIVVDGGSDDGSKAIIERHAGELAWWVSEPDRGQTDALTKGFARAHGEICGWLCSDDLLLPQALHRIGAYFRDHPEVDVVFGDALWIDASGALIKPKREMPFNRFVFLHGYNYVPQPSTFWRRSLYEQVGGLTPGFDIAMDNDLWEKFSRHSRIAHMPAYLSCMRYYLEQKTTAPHMRQRGHQEGTSVMLRGSQLARACVGRPLLGSALRVAARATRVVQKAAAGGYTARAPNELLPWLKAHATDER
ncbi:glycosyltransferase family 2 protein [Lacisediminimonas sp.]|uniref:glycosyltransferase family 2 protein n=1 Tax=Lacisediminimonas sp. TaxID=3060582 RepID=UPI002725ECFE|nr:glycosyltransferase family 2 protein [Lacisediminimonas sp.]MDO8300772.1 glycosyltransferase family 2 protein [Lacisediminimonas sp.]MDO9215912.1 glycosyltransferase family 2 protein [Lacisediminimonas sp.]